MATTRHTFPLVLALLVASLSVVVAAPAQATATPWRFANAGIAQISVGAGAENTATATCPANYELVGGGFGVSSSDFERVSEFRNGTNQYSVTIHSFSGAPITLSAYPVCALASHVGGLQVVSAEFARDPTTFIAGGTVACGGGKRALFGGADWNDATVGRRIDLTTPTSDGGSWIASGWNPQAGTSLHVEAYCVAGGDVYPASSPVVFSVDHASGGAEAHEITCPAGRRIVSGGAFAGPAGNGVPDPTVYHADEYESRNTSPLAWTTSVRYAAGTRVTYTAWCLQASQPFVIKFGGPPALTNSTTAHFTYQISDSVGEQVIASCYLDDQLHACSGFDDTIGSIGAGPHTYQVKAVNASAQTAEATWAWTVDLTPPTVTVPDTLDLYGPIGLTFSEPVTGLTAASVQVRVAGVPTPLTGTVSAAVDGLSASWQPAAPLVPGEGYTVTTTDAVQDQAGNSASTTPQPTWAAKVVESSTSLVVETWDPDKSTAASGGGYASSRAAGSKATWRFTTTAGQKATVFGVRQRTGGKADVYVDGVKRTTVSFYATSTKHQVAVFTSAALSAGQHTVEVRLLGSKVAASSGTWVALDFLRYGAAVLQENKAIQRFGHVSAAPASQGSYETASHQLSGDTGGVPSYAVLFRGTGVNLFVTRSPDSGKAKIYVDGVLRKTVNLTSANTGFQYLVAVTGLSDARHRLRIDLVGSTGGAGSAVGLDRIDVIRIVS